MKSGVLRIAAGLICAGIVSVTSAGSAYAGWTKNSIGWRYENEDGSSVRSAWVKDSKGRWYHFGADGYMQTGWLKENEKWYYLGSDGVMLCSQWETIDGNRYYFTEDGSAETRVFQVKDDVPAYTTPSRSGSGGGSYDYANDENYKDTNGLNAAYAEQLLDLINSQRALEGKSYLQIDSRLTDAAQTRVQELAVSYSHNRPDKTSYRTVLDSANITYKKSAELIARDERIPQAALRKWQSSSSDKRDLLDEAVGRIGAACYVFNGTTYWVVLTIGV